MHMPLVQLLVKLWKKKKRVSKQLGMRLKMFANKTQRSCCRPTLNPRTRRRRHLSPCFHLCKVFKNARQAARLMDRVFFVGVGLSVPIIIKTRLYITTLQYCCNIIIIRLSSCMSANQMSNIVRRGEKNVRYYFSL